MIYGLRNRLKKLQSNSSKNTSSIFFVNQNKENWECLQNGKALAVGKTVEDVTEKINEYCKNRYNFSDDEITIFIDDVPEDD